MGEGRSAKSGSTPQHNRITVNISSSLNLQLHGRTCQVFSIDVRVKVPATDLYTYPDVAVVCERLVFDERDANTLVNPNVIVEVLSKSTELYDREGKFAHYQRLESLKDYILVAQDKYRVEHFVRQNDHQWSVTVLDSLQDRVSISSIDTYLALSDIYSGLEAFPL